MTRPGDVVDGVARYLPVAEHDVVVSRGMGIDAERAKRLTHHLQIPCEGLADVILGSDVGEHDVAHVSIDAPSPTLAPVGADAVTAAVFDIHLIGRILVASEDDGGHHLPHEEVIGGWQMTGHEFFHREVEGEVLCWLEAIDIDQL